MLSPIELVRFEAKITKGEGCWLWTAAKSHDGYGHFWHDGRCQVASRLAYEQASGPIPPGMLVLHRCDTPACCNPAHLFLGTDLTNNQDCVQKGRSRRAKGEAHGRARLSEAQVLFIQGMKASGATLRELAETFRVCRATIHHAVSGRNWSHLHS